MTGTVTLEAVESFLPEREVRVDDLAGLLGLRRAEVGVFKKIYGLDRLRFDPECGLFDLVLPAARQALKALPDGRPLSYVIYAHTMQTLTPPDVDAAARIRDDLGLHDTEAFSLTQQACVSSLGAIDLAGELLRAEAPPGAYALMVTGERAYSPQVQLIPNSAVMAEAAASCLVTLDGDGDRVLAHATSTLGAYAAGLEMTREEIAGFGGAYSTALAEIIHRAVREAGLTFEDIGLVLPHNVNMVSWRQTIKEMGADPARFFLENIPRYSHCYASDVFVNYTTAREQGLLVDGGHYVLVSVGLGATFGATVITHRKR